jgi:hypothetical protein
MKKNDEEHRIQCAFIKLARMYLAHTAYIIYANPNQGYTGGKEGSKEQRKALRWGAYFKEEGKLEGVPDTFLAWPRLGFAGLYIEFKLPKCEIRGIKKTYLSKAQKSVIETLRDAGYCVAVCRDAMDAYELLKRYTLGSEKDEVMNDWNWK